jgi:hypothetical protein
MTNAEADALIATLPKPGGLQLYRKGDEIVMDGGKRGGHSIRASVSSGERLLVHWKGYVENNGHTLGPGYTSASPSVSRERIPAVGQMVTFPSKSAKSGTRRGQVVKVTPKRVLIAYRFNYEREYDKKHGLKFDPSNARTVWRKLSEIQL